MSTIKIKKAKIVNGKRTSHVEVIYDESTEKGQHASVEKTPEWEPHEDLRTAMNKLAVHYALMNEFIPIDKKAKSVQDYELAKYANIIVSGYSISGDEGKEAVILTGHRLLTTGKAQIVNTPLEPIDSENGYKYMDDLVEQIEAIDKEVILYINGTKIKPVVEQGQLALEES